VVVNSFRDLRVWQAGMDLVERLHRATRTFLAEETYRLAIQMRRASVSIPSNIAEGHARAPSKEFLNHLSMAQGSLSELQTQLEIAGRLKYIPQGELEEILRLTVSLAKQLHALPKALPAGARNPDRKSSLTPNP
jgi:four helix bundle protein